MQPKLQPVRACAGRFALPSAHSPWAQGSFIAGRSLCPGPADLHS